MVLLADSSELGWRVVHEYETNPLADDSDDEKRIQKAEARETRNMKAERGRRGRGRSAPYPRTGRVAATSRLAPQERSFTPAPMKPGVCFSCGKPGHWKGECPGTSSNNKMSSTCICSLESSIFRPMGSASTGAESGADEGIGEPVQKSPVGRLKQHINKWTEVTSDPYIIDVVENGYINPHLHLFKVKLEDIKLAEALFQPGSYIFTYDLKSAYHHIDICETHWTFLGFSWELDGETKYFVYCSLPFGIATAGHIYTKVLRVVVAFMRSKGHKLVMFLDDGIGGDTSFNKALSSSEFVQQSILEFGFLLA